MECNNNLIAIAKKEGGMDKETLEAAVLLLAPFAPHMGRRALGGTGSYGFCIPPRMAGS